MQDQRLCAHALCVDWKERHEGFRVDRSRPQVLQHRRPLWPQMVSCFAQNYRLLWPPLFFGQRLLSAVTHAVAHMSVVACQSVDSSPLDDRKAATERLEEL